MPSNPREQKKAKLLKRASDFRGNEHERRLAEESYRRMCQSEAAAGAEASQRRRRKRRRHSERPEFNRVERAVIGAGAVVVFGAFALRDWLKRRAPKASVSGIRRSS